MLAIPGATVAGVSFTPEGVVVALRRRKRRLLCPQCGLTTRATSDRSTRRWRHLDLGSSRLHLEGEIRRLDCRRCQRVLTEEVPWARPGARHTRDLEDMVAWCAQRMDKTTVSRLLGVSWEAVAAIVRRVVASSIDHARLDELYRIGVDEVSYLKGHRYLTVVADHDRSGAAVWAAEGRDAAVLASFFDELGDERIARLEPISMDMGEANLKAVRDAAEHRGLTARVAIDPFHVIKLANEAVDKARRWAWNQARRSGHGGARWVKRTRWALVKDRGNLSTAQRLILEELRRSGSVLYRAWLLKDGLKEVYRMAVYGVAASAQFLDRWLAWACRSRIPSFVKLAKTIRKHREGILAAHRAGAVELQTGSAQFGTVALADFRVKGSDPWP